MLCCTSHKAWDKKFQSWNGCLPELYRLDDIKTRDKKDFSQTVANYFTEAYRKFSTYCSYWQHYYYSFHKWLNKSPGLFGCFADKKKICASPLYCLTPLVPEPVCFRALVYSWGSYKLLKTQLNHHSQGLFQADVNDSKCNKNPMNQLKRTQSLAVMILQNDSRNDKTLNEKFPRLNIKTTTFSHRYCTMQQSKKAKSCPKLSQNMALYWN